MPADRLQDQRCLQVAAFEVVSGSTLQPLVSRTQDHEVPPEPEGKVDGPVAKFFRPVCELCEKAV